MKTLFIEAKYGKPIKIGRGIAEKLPSRVGLVSSIQFLDNLPLIKKSIKNKPINKKNNKIKNKKVIIGGQVLGCNVQSAEKIKDKVDAFLYVGDGKFHPLGVALATKKPVFTFNPLNNHFSKIKKEEIDAYKRRRKSSLVKFLHAENVGVIVSTKSGQYYPLSKLDSIIKKINKKYPDKKFYTFIAETIDYNQLENFPFIQAWVNTACPRIEEDIRILNLEDIR